MEGYTKLSILPDEIISSMADFPTGKQVNECHEDSAAQERACLTFPLSVFPQQIQRIAKILHNDEGLNLDYLCASMFTALVAAMGNQWTCQFTTTWRVSPIIFMVLVGAPSCGKTPPLRLAVRPFHIFDAELSRTYQKEKERYDMAMELPKEERAANGFDKNPVKPVCRSVVTTNTTIEGLYANLDKNRRGILMHVDELDSFLGNMSRYSRGNDEAYWLQLFNGDEIKCLMMQQLGLTREQFGQMQWMAYQHERTDHNGKLRHWHVLANRVLPDGTVVSDSHIGRKAVRVANDISRELGFSVAENISPQNKKEIKDAAFRVLKGMQCYTFEVFKVRMAKEGFPVQEAYSKSGKLQGYYISSQSDTLYKASAIDRNMTLGRIENTWRLIRSGRYRREDADETVQATRSHAGSWPHVATPRLSSVLNARTDHTHSRNREDEVGVSRSHYDDENNEYRNKGYTM